jgi:hypothetical protein
MGKKAKEHRKKVAKRNQKIKQQEKTIQKVWQEAFEEQLNKVREGFSAKTEVEDVKNIIDIDTINSKIESLEESVNLIQDETTEINFQGIVEKINSIKKEFPNIEEDLNNENETEKNTESTEPISGNKTI